MAENNTETQTQWAVYEDGGELRILQIERVNERTYRLQDGQKIAHQRVWMLLPKFDSDIAKKAKALAQQIDIASLRQAAGDAERSADELAALAQSESTNSDNSGIWRLAVLQSALAHPAYFHRGRGKLRPASDTALAAALADIEGKRAMRERRSELINQLHGGEMPEAIATMRDAILLGTAKNSAEYAAVQKVAGGAPESMARFFQQRGLLKDARDYWRAIFNAAWPADAEEGGITDAPVLQDAPAKAAFSIDDAGTFEIDDAFSAEQNGEGKWRIGVHIAAPALGIVCGGAADKAAFAKMTSVYFPDGKRPMLPQAALDRYSMQTGKARPVLSVYFDFNNANNNFSQGATVLELLTLRAAFTPEDMDGDLPPDIAAQYKVLCDFAAVLPQPEGAVRQGGNVSFTIEPPSVCMRPRAPSSYVVEAMMRLVNGVWARRLAQSGGGLFRRDGATKLCDKNAEEYYAWISSPLRRYADLANQRLLLSLLYGYDDGGINDWQKLASVFDSRYVRAKYYQRIVERHYALRALQLAPDIAGRQAKTPAASALLARLKNGGRAKNATCVV